MVIRQALERFLCRFIFNRQVAGIVVDSETAENQVLLVRRVGDKSVEKFHRFLAGFEVAKRLRFKAKVEIVSA
jgi:hypothetical protein